MPDIFSARHQLPLLISGQAQKELTHNEALLRVDALLHPVAEAQLNAPPLINAQTIAGQCWLIGTAPTAEWAGKSNQIAYWTGGSWRYCAPVQGMRLRIKASGLEITYINNAWTVPVTISNPSGGGVVDAEARTAINAILVRLRQTGEIAL
jgi:Protein of unknown function (DUF2793)